MNHKEKNTRKIAMYSKIGMLIILQLIGLNFQTESLVQAIGSDELSPGQRSGQEMIFDPVTSEIVLYGGAQGNSGQNDLTSVWKFSIEESIWKEIVPEIFPTPRFNHKMVYLPNNRSFFLFGGTKSSNYERLADSWLFHLDTDEWEELTPSHGPTSRSDHGMVYDSFNNKIIVFGGYGGDDQKRNDLWEFSPENNSWSEITPISSPPAQYGQALFYREMDHIAYNFGGHENGYSNDLWGFNGSVKSWNIVPGGTTLPAKRYWHRMEYSRSTDAGYLFGGDDGNYLGEALDDTWKFNFTTNNWEELILEVSPPGRVVFSMCHDTILNRMYIYGGYADDFTVVREDLWGFDCEFPRWYRMDDDLTSSTNSIEGHILLGFLSSFAICVLLIIQKKKSTYMKFKN